VSNSFIVIIIFRWNRSARLTLSLMLVDVVCPIRRQSLFSSSVQNLLKSVLWLRSVSPTIELHFVNTYDFRPSTGVVSVFASSGFILMDPSRKMSLPRPLFLFSIELVFLKFDVLQDQCLVTLRLVFIMALCGTSFTRRRVIASLLPMYVVATSRSIGQRRIFLGSECGLPTSGDNRGENCCFLSDILSAAAFPNSNWVMEVSCDIPDSWLSLSKLPECTLQANLSQCPVAIPMSRVLFAGLTSYSDTLIFNTPQSKKMSF